MIEIMVDFLNVHGYWFILGSIFCPRLAVPILATAFLVKTNVAAVTLIWVWLIICDILRSRQIKSTIKEMIDERF